MIEVQGGTYVRTVVYYDRKNHCLFGSDALAEWEAKGRDILNEDFKMDLGNEDPAFGKPKRRFPTANAGEKSAGEITGDFLEGLLSQIREWLDQNNLGDHIGIVVAEPVTMRGKDVDGKWLGNYRDAIRRILLGKGFTKEQIEFLPEPFAVFQYYKYGLKHPLLGQSKQCALVIDFGGGSFDSCIIESDKQGEVTGKAKNTKPYAAFSDAVGGYFVNQIIAERLFYKCAKGDKTKCTNIRKGMENYRRWRKGELPDTYFSTPRPDLNNFVRNFHHAIYDIEDPKIALVDQIDNWEPDAPLKNVNVTVRLPKDPFSESPNYFDAILTAEEFREWFIKEVWEQRLKAVIKNTLDRGQEKLLGNHVNIVLLSGGSCNIRWIEKLIERDFPIELSNATVLQLEDSFLEVVAKGLAVECTRRFYDDSSRGDFTSVTYNGLNLLLDADKRGIQHKDFIPTSDNPIPQTGKRCVLIPAASVLSGHLDKPLTWKVRLDRHPRHFLNYYFLRAGLSPYSDEEFGESGEKKYSEHLLNLEHHNVSTPANSSFDNSTLVELKIEKERKTASVRFIYARDNQGSSIEVEGKPFFIDMTDTQDQPKTKSYIGLDFGTSNTAVSFINQAAVKAYEKRSNQQFWLDLNELCHVIPYPLAAPLARHLREYEKRQLADTALEFVESALAIASYISYLELCSLKKLRADRQDGTLITTHPSTKYFKSFTQRSVGPLWGLLRDTQRALGDDAHITRPYHDLLSEPYYDEIDSMVTELGEYKHQKRSAESLNLQIVKLIANVSRRVFMNYWFGHFENVLPERFKKGNYNGRFRPAHGDSTNFVESMSYSGSSAFPNGLAYLVNFEDRIALPLAPLIFWYGCEQHPSEEHCYFYDIRPKGEPPPLYSHKATAFSCQLSFDGTHPDLSEFFSELTRWCAEDPKIELISF